MEIEIKDRKIILKRELSELDRFVTRSVRILDKLKLKYVIVSGYVSILFGRTRTTEDIDIFIGQINKTVFSKFLECLKESKMWIINTTGNWQAYEMLSEEAIRIADKEKAIPNIEIKIAKDPDEMDELNNPIEVLLNESRLFISSIEGQIAFKFYLGAEKDIEDAVHLLEVFKDKLNKELLFKKAKKLNVENELMKYVG